MKRDFINFTRKSKKATKITREEITFATELYLMFGGVIDKLEPSNVNCSTNYHSHDLDGETDNFLLGY